MDIDVNPKITDPFGANNPVPGMRVGRYDQYPESEVVNVNFTWNNVKVSNTDSAMEPVPPVGWQLSQQSAPQARPIKVGTDR